MLIAKRFSLSHSKLLDFLTRLPEAKDVGITLYLPVGTPCPDVEKLIKASGMTSPPVDLPELTAGGRSGAVIFWGESQKYLVLPPFPITERYIGAGYDAEPLRDLLGKDYGIALVLVRLGSYAVGFCQGESLVSSKVGTGLVHGRHRQGGSSAHRFERHRDKQIETFLNRVCGHIMEKLSPHARTVDFLVYGGARTTIQLLHQQCPFLHQFADRLLPPLLDIPEPRQAVLESAVGRVWSSTVIQWVEAE
ncbi:MAG: hypothetical protein HY670_04385 [Chloroflexi bacterium]|nr:hypothetical protein [Chloroflexota bacterium]